MKFRSSQVKGKGRGKLLGFPTINLKVPENIEIPDGIYAVRVYLDGATFLGAMHSGPIPVFNESEKTIEVFLIDIDSESLPEQIPDLEIETIKYLRPVMNFKTEQELSAQIAKDVEDTKQSANL
jgi:riboflavin kinase/FMN adenylyltransferase